MIGGLRNFAKTKLAAVLVFIIIIPFVFWGMGSMFNTGNTNNIAKINNTNISTQDFMEYLNSSGIPEKTIRENINQNIIEELLSNLISTRLLDLEINDFNIKYSENVILKKIKLNENFLDENKKFQRTKYEKFLLSNNISAPVFELRLKNRELQKQLFDYIGAGTKSPNFLLKSMFEEENKKINIEYINLENIYKSKNEITEKDLELFVNENSEQLKSDYIDLSYIIITPKKLTGIDEFNEVFFDKIDEIENDISNNFSFNEIIEKLNIKETIIKNYTYLDEKENKILNKIFNLRNNKIDLIESEDNYILFNIDKIQSLPPDLNNEKTKIEIRNLVHKKNKFEFNNDLLDKIQNKKFDNKKFIDIGNGQIKKTTINSIKDNKIFEINSIELLYSLPIKSFTILIDEKENFYLVKIENFKNQVFDSKNENHNSFIENYKSNQKNSILKSYDAFLNDKYDIVLNQKTIDRVKNYFK